MIGMRIILPLMNMWGSYAKGYNFIYIHIYIYMKETIK
jgi:hypothetical protein